MAVDDWVKDHMIILTSAFRKASFQRIEQQEAEERFVIGAIPEA